MHLDGRESEKSLEARRFGKWLGDVTGLPVEFFDERFTSLEAEQLLLGAELTKKRRKKRLDMLAAQIMLAAYLNRRAKPAAREAWRIEATLRADATFMRQPNSRLGGGFARILCLPFPSFALGFGPAGYTADSGYSFNAGSDGCR